MLYLLSCVCSSSVSCSSGCHCAQEAFNPVCGSDGVEFRSPCHAGCVAMEMDDNNKAVVGTVSSFYLFIVTCFPSDTSCCHTLTKCSELWWINQFWVCAPLLVSSLRSQFLLKPMTSHLVFVCFNSSLSSFFIPLWTRQRWWAGRLREAGGRSQMERYFL